MIPRARIPEDTNSALFDANESQNNQLERNKGSHDQSFLLVSSFEQMFKLGADKDSFKPRSKQRPQSNMDAPDCPQSSLRVKGPMSALNPSSATGNVQGMPPRPFSTAPKFKSSFTSFDSIKCPIKAGPFTLSFLGKSSKEKKGNQKDSEHFSSRSQYETNMEMTTSDQFRTSSKNMRKQKAMTQQQNWKSNSLPRNVGFPESQSIQISGREVHHPRRASFNGGGLNTVSNSLNSNSNEFTPPSSSKQMRSSHKRQRSYSGSSGGDSGCRLSGSGDLDSRMGSSDGIQRSAAATGAGASFKYTNSYNNSSGDNQALTLIYNEQSKPGSITSSRLSNISGPDPGVGGSNISFLVEHLTSFTMSREDTLWTVDDAIRKLKLQDMKGKIWYQEMQLDITASALNLVDVESGEQIESFPYNGITHVEAVLLADYHLNSILAFIYRDNTGRKPAIFLFRCDQTPADQVVADIQSAMLSFKKNKSSKYAKAACKKMSNTAQRRKHSVRATAQETVAQPREYRQRSSYFENNSVTYYKDNGSMDDLVDNLQVDMRAPHSVGVTGGSLKDRGGSDSYSQNELSVLQQLALRVERQVAILNHCFDDIELFAKQLKMVHDAQQELVKRKKKNGEKKKRPNGGDNMLEYRARMPSETSYIDTFQKFKLSFNLLAPLKKHIQQPNAPELVHSLFSPLAKICESEQGMELARGVLSPLLSEDAVQLLENCLNSEERAFWNRLGNAWTVSKDKWPREHYEPPYKTVFRDGWEPPLLERHNGTNSQDRVSGGAVETSSRSSNARSSAVTQNTTEESDDDESSVMASSLTETKVEEILVRSNQCLLLRTTVDIFGKTIVFKAVEGFKGFRDEVKVDIPRFSVLGKETICLEIIPVNIINNYNQMGINRNIITPILHLDRKNNSPFLGTVTITLPVISGWKKWLASGIKNCPTGMECSKDNSSVTITTKTFSPVGVVYDSSKKVLDAMGLNDDCSITYEKPAIYLIIDQSTGRCEFDLRKFTNWQEHRKYRMDETKFFCMLFNPQEGQECFYNTEINVTIEGDFELENINASSRVDGNVFKFWLPNPKNNVDRRNRRCVRIRQLKSDNHFNLRISYESKDLRRFAEEYIESIRLLTPMQIRYITSILNLVNDQKPLIQFLQILDGKWMEFLEQHLKIDIHGLREFILDDIKYTIQESYDSSLSETNMQSLQRKCHKRGYYHYNISGDSIESLLGSVFNNFRIGMQLKTAKIEILRMLMDSRIISKGPISNEGLHPKYCEILSSALMYIPVQKLKDSIKGMYDEGKVSQCTDKLKEFIQSCEEEKMETR